MARYEYRVGMLLTESPLPSAGSSTVVVEASGLGGVADARRPRRGYPRFRVAEVAARGDRGR
eukprot:6304210-Prymnesium_polylepis.1